MPIVPLRLAAPTRCRPTVLVLALAATLPLAGCGASDDPTPEPTAASEGGPGATPTDPLEGMGEAAAEAIRSASEQADAAVEDARERIEEISAETRAAGETYLEALGDLLAGVGGVRSQMDALTKSPAIASAADRVRDALAAVDALSPEAVASLKQAFAPQLASLTDRYRAELDRLRSIEGLAAVVEIMEGVNLLPAAGGNP